MVNARSLLVLSMGDRNMGLRQRLPWRAVAALLAVMVLPFSVKVVSPGVIVVQAHGSLTAGRVKLRRTANLTAVVGTNEPRSRPQILVLLGAFVEPLLERLPIRIVFSVEIHIVRQVVRLTFSKNSCSRVSAASFSNTRKRMSTLFAIVRAAKTRRNGQTIFVQLTRDARLATHVCRQQDTSGR